VQFQEERVKGWGDNHFLVVFYFFSYRQLTSRRCDGQGGKKEIIYNDTGEKQRKKFGLNPPGRLDPTTGDDTSHILDPYPLKPVPLPSYSNPWTPWPPIQQMAATTEEPTQQETYRFFLFSF